MPGKVALVPERALNVRAGHGKAACEFGETYGLLVAEHGWSMPDWSGWARRHLRTEFFPGTS